MRRDSLPDKPTCERLSDPQLQALSPTQVDDHTLHRVVIGSEHHVVADDGTYDYLLGGKFGIDLFLGRGLCGNPHLQAFDSTGKKGNGGFAGRIETGDFIGKHLSQS